MPDYLNGNRFALLGTDLRKNMPAGPADCPGLLMTSGEFTLESTEWRAIWMGWSKGLRYIVSLFQSIFVALLLK